LFAFLIIQICLIPHGLFANSGISFYSVQRLTVIPYILGFIGCCYFTLKSAQLIPNSNPNLNILRKSLQLFAVLLLGLTLSPDIAYTIVASIHVFFGASIFSLALLVAFWLSIKVTHDSTLIILSLVQLVAGFICFFSLIDVLWISI